MFGCVCVFVCALVQSAWPLATEHTHLSRQTSDTGRKADGVANLQLQPEKKATQCTLLPGSGKMSFVNKWPIYFPSHQWTRGTWFIFSVLEAMEWKREGGQWRWGGWSPAAFTFCANNHRKSLNVSLNEPYIGAILIRKKKKSNSKCKLCSQNGRWWLSIIWGAF